jgi:hypothetical protein
MGIPHLSLVLAGVCAATVYRIGKYENAAEEKNPTSFGRFYDRRRGPAHCLTEEFAGGG